MPTSKINTKFDLKQDAITFVIVVAACFIQALAINGFYVPHSFLSGGVTGVALLLDYVFDIPSWIPIIILNIPISIIGLKYLNAKFIIFSVIGTLVLSGALALTKNFNIVIENELVAAAVGAAVIGISGAPVVRRGATLGGIDVISVILGKRFSMSMGTINIMFNIIIMSVLGFVRGIEIALVSMIAMFVSNVAFNYAVQGLNRTVTVFVISDKWVEIAPEVMTVMHRGVTYISAQGAYTGAERKVVYCIVKTVELSALKRIVYTRDPKAMVSVIETREVVGRGFGSLN